jgi:hypothetical protein
VRVDKTKPEERTDTAPPQVAPDMMPTQAAQPIYRGPEPEKPERSVVVVEATEHVRASREAGAKRPEPSELPGAALKLRAAARPPLTRGMSDRRTRIPDLRSVAPWIIAAFAVAVAIGVIGAYAAGRKKPTAIDPIPTPAAPSEGEAKQEGEPEPDTGEVTIFTEPGATVFAGDSELGRADERGSAGPFRFPAGTLDLRVTLGPKGFERARTVQIRPNQIHEIEIRARQGWIQLAVAPWAKVQVDGTDVGITPLPNLILDEGTHRLVLVNPDLRKRHETLVKVEAGSVTPLKIDLHTVGQPM